MIISEELTRALRATADTVINPLKDCQVFSVRAERDIQMEQSNQAVRLDPDGKGATNILRKHLHTTDAAFPRERITQDLLKAMNAITAPEIQFTEIGVREHDAMSPPFWEVYLGEEGKGVVPLSRSGSGLKTIILVLLNLLIMPEHTAPGKSLERACFVFEELENNLHPAILRRLLRFIESYCVEHGCRIFLTTHSSATLDFFGANERAHIVRVSHDGRTARTQQVTGDLERVDLIAELGAKPSDLLHANGIIWVEGPSDRIYINRFIELFSEGKFREGRDYQCASYGGRLLSKLQVRAGDEEERDLVNLFRINTNLVVVCDSDRSSSRGNLKEDVRRIKRDAESVGAEVWIGACKEIENYLPGAALGAALGITGLPDPAAYEPFWPRNRNQHDSYVVAHLPRKSIQKVELASRVVPHLGVDMLRHRFDLAEQVEKILTAIRKWNA